MVVEKLQSRLAQDVVLDVGVLHGLPLLRLHGLVRALDQRLHEQLGGAADKPARVHRGVFDFFVEAHDPFHTRQRQGKIGLGILLLFLPALDNLAGSNLRGVLALVLRINRLRLRLIRSLLVLAQELPLLAHALGDVAHAGLRVSQGDQLSLGGLAHLTRENKVGCDLLRPHRERSLISSRSALSRACSRRVLRVGGLASLTEISL